MRRLIIRPGAIGDCLLALPAIEFLRTDETELWLPSATSSLFGQGRISATCGLQVRSIASTGIDRFGLGDGFVPVGLSEALLGFDDIVSWYGENRQEFRQAALRINPAWRFLRALPPGDCSLHATDYFLSQVGAALRSTPQSIILRPSDSPQGRHGAIAIHPFSGSQAKNWPLDRYRELAKQLPLGSEVVLLAGPEDELLEARRFDDLRSLASWLSGAALYIGNDSGPTHLAAAMGTTVLALFGPTNPSVWAPRGPHLTVLQRQPLTELSVDEVIVAARRMIAQSGS